MTSNSSPQPAATSPQKGHGQWVTLLFSNVGLLLAAVVLIVAAWFGQVPIVILTGLVVATIGTARLWSHFCLKGLKYERSLSEHRLFPEEEAELRVRITNRKPLPLLWLEAEDPLPRGLSLDSGDVPEANLSLRASLLWYQRISWSYCLRPQKRGYYTLGPAKLTSGDIFGLYPRYLIAPETENLIVYPRIYPMARLGLPAQRLLGEAKTSRPIIHDPTRTVGIRDYTPSDPLKHIHWKASARHRGLQVKTFEPTTSLEVMLLLAVDSFQDDQGEELELALSTVASVAHYLAEHDHQVGLMVNTRLADSGEAAKILPGSSPEHLITILEVLAKTTPAFPLPLAHLLGQEVGSLPWGATLVLVAARVSEPLSELLHNLKRAGHKVLVLGVGPEIASSAGAEFALWTVTRPHDLATGPAELEMAGVA